MKKMKKRMAWSCLIVAALFPLRTSCQSALANARTSQRITKPAPTATAAELGAINEQSGDHTAFLTATIEVDGVKYARTAAGVNGAIAAATNEQTVMVLGNVSLSSPITMNRAGVTLQCTNGAGIYLDAPTNTDLVIVSASNTRITGCIFDGNSTKQSTGGYGINISSARLRHVDIDHNEIRNTWNEGIRIANASYLRITQNRLANNGQPVASAFAIDYTMQMRSASTENFVTISDNEIDESSSSIGGINLAANIVGGVIQKWHIDRNTIIVGDNGSRVELGVQAFAGALPGNIVSDGTVNGNIISGSNLTNTSTWGISVGLAGVTHGNVVVSGNSIRDTRATCIEGIGSGIVITGNSCDDTDGITVTTNSAPIDGVVVTGNVLTNGSAAFQNFAQIGISAYPSYSLRGLVVANNSIFNVPESRSCIYLNGHLAGQIKDSQVIGNFCQGQTSGMTKHAIVISQTVHVAVESNMVRDWVGKDVYGIIVGPTSIGTILSRNEALNALGTWEDQGFATLIDDLAGAPYSVKYQSFGTRSEADGSRIFCSNCKVANPCADRGTGALAKRLNGVWVCN